jgi:uncharacterized protein (DUF1778 family)
MRRAEMLRIRVTPAEKRVLQEAAQQNQQTLSDFLREAINEVVADCRDDRVLRTSK